MERGNPVEDASDEPVTDVPYESVEDRPTVAVICTSPDRTVFTEEGNTDAWIATDLTVEPDR